MICLAMFLNGLKMTGIIAIKVLLMMEVLGLMIIEAQNGWFVVVVGTALTGIVDPHAGVPGGHCEIEFFHISRIFPAIRKSAAARNIKAAITWTSVSPKRTGGLSPLRKSIKSLRRE